MDHAEARFEALIEAAPDAMIGVDESGIIQWANGQTERLFGYAREELIGQPVEVLVPEAARAGHPARRAGYADPRPRPMGAGMELAGRRKDGTEFPAEISLSGIDTDEGRQVCAAVRDVTDRKRAEQKFRALLEAAPDAVLGVDAGGTIVMANGQAERLFGYTRQQLIGQPVEMLVPNAVREIHPLRRAGYVRDPQPRPMGAGMELAARRRDGSEFPAEISLSAIDTEDGLLVSAAVRDVSERIEARLLAERLSAAADREALEARLNQAQRLESLGQLAGGVAHDFNNLLGAILNYAAFVGDEIDQLDLPAAKAETLRHDVGQIRRAVEHGAALTHQLLAFGRREVVRPELISLNDVITGVEDMLRRTIGEDIELDVRLAGQSTTILADRGRIEQVLVNLAVNARDAMVGGGTLLIDSAIVDVDDLFIDGFAGIKQGRYVRLRVSDTGHGMPPEVLQHAFEPFYTTKPKGEGTGLGLATVYGIVTQAGGFVQIYSEIDHGTSLTALFPAADGRPAEPVPAAVSQPETGTETVLVVEDEEAMRDVTASRILRRNGYQVLVASNGPEAIELVRQHTSRIDLLLTDVVMPQMLGKEVAERVRAMRPGTRVVFMSGYAEPVLSSKGTLDPSIVLVEKPFSEASLLARVREVLDR